MYIYYLNGYKEYTRRKKISTMDVVIDSGVLDQAKIRVYIKKIKVKENAYEFREMAQS